MRLILLLIFLFTSSSLFYAEENTPLKISGQENPPIQVQGANSVNLDLSKKKEDDKYNQCIASYDEFRKSFRKNGCEDKLKEHVKDLSLFFGFGLRTFGFNMLRVDPENNEEAEAAEMIGDPNPAIYYTASLGTNFLFDSNLAYDFTFGLYNFTVTKQRLNRDAGEVDVDLGNYITGNILFFTPRLFYSFGANDDTPDEYLNVGIGAGGGYSYFKGNIYLTEGVERSNSACHLAGEELAELVESEEEGTKSRSSIENEIRDNCELQRIENQGSGFSFGVFISARMNSFFVSLEYNQVEQNAGDYIFQPTTTALTMAYVVDL